MVLALERLSADAADLVLVYKAKALIVDFCAAWRSCFWTKSSSSDIPSSKAAYTASAYLNPSFTDHLQSKRLKEVAQEALTLSTLVEVGLHEVLHSKQCNGGTP